jgi:membrane associated rhomboid family serine protease
MIPIGDENPTLRTPYMTFLLLGATIASWLVVQGAGFDSERLAASVCNLGLVPGEVTGQAPVGFRVPISRLSDCVVDRERINILTPITSMFLHGGWGHLLGNMLFFWVFGNNVEDSMGHARFLAFYLICGIVAALAHILVSPASPVPTVGASGAVSGIMGAYLVLYPQVRVRMLFFFLIFFKVIALRAWLVLIFWFLWQVLSGLPELTRMRPDVSGGVAVWAHVGGFVAGVVLIKLFERRSFVAERNAGRRLRTGEMAVIPEGRSPW